MNRFIAFFSFTIIQASLVVDIRLPKNKSSGTDAIEVVGFSSNLAADSNENTVWNNLPGLNSLYKDVPNHVADKNGISFAPSHTVWNNLPGLNSLYKDVPNHVAAFWWKYGQNCMARHQRLFLNTLLSTKSTATSFFGDEYLDQLKNVFTLESQLLLLQLVFSVVLCFNYSKLMSCSRETSQGNKQTSMKTEIARITTSAAAFSMIVTSTTPISRVLYKKWLGTHGFAHLQAAAGTMNMEDGYYDYNIENSSAVDYSWALHATFGLLWVIAGCMAIRSGASNERRHRTFWGYIAVVAYVFHNIFALSNLYLNHAQHLLMNRVALLLNLLESGCHMAAAFRALSTSDDKNKKETHMKHMFVSYIYSTEGAGQIRFVAIVNKLLRRSSEDFCVKKLYRFDSSCAWPYLERMCLIRFTSKFILALYCYRNEKDQDMWSYVKNGLKMNVVVLLMIWIFQYFNASSTMAILSLFQALDYICGFYCIIKNGVDQTKPLGIPSFFW